MGSPTRIHAMGSVCSSGVVGDLYEGAKTLQSAVETAAEIVDEIHSSSNSSSSSSSSSSESDSEGSGGEGMVTRARQADRQTPLDLKIIIVSDWLGVLASGKP